MVWFKQRFFGGIQNNLKIVGSVRISLLGSSLNTVKPNLLNSLATSPWNFWGVSFWCRGVLGLWLLPSFDYPRPLKFWVLPLVPFFFLELVFEHYYCYAGHLGVLDRKCMIKRSGTFVRQEAFAWDRVSIRLINGIQPTSSNCSNKRKEGELYWIIPCSNN